MKRYGPPRDRPKPRPRPKGLYKKFEVRRTDGESENERKHSGCEYFVLDLDHDLYAWPALEAYALACGEEYPALAADLRRKIAERHAADALEYFDPPDRGGRHPRAPRLAELEELGTDDSST